MAANKNILLVRPCAKYPIDKNDSTYNRIWFPLSMCITASLLRNTGFKPIIYDAHAKREKSEEVLKHIKSNEFEKIFVFTTDIDRWQCPNININYFLELCNKLNDENIAFHLVGPHCTSRPKEMLDMTKAKGCVVGEPEFTILDICHDKPPHRIEGVAFYDDDKFRIKKAGKRASLDQFPSPAFDLVNISDYQYEFLGKDFVLLESSRGCVYNCSMCFKKMYGPPVYRKKSIKTLARDLDLAIENGAKSVHFFDLDFCINKKLVNQLCDYIILKKYQINWTCHTRPDIINEQLLKKMERAGLKLVHYGIETCSKNAMRQINKKMSLKKVEERMKLTASLNIDTVCFFMFGFPNETEDDIKRTVEFAQELNPTYASFHIITPYKGTEIYEKMKNKEELFPLYFATKNGLSHEKLLKLRKEAYFEFYLRPKYVASRLLRRSLSDSIRDLRFFTNFIKNI